MNLADQLTVARAAAVPQAVLLFVWDFGGSGLDYARLAPRLLRGGPTPETPESPGPGSTFSSSPASRQTLR